MITREQCLLGKGKERKHSIVGSIGGMVVES